MLNHLARSLGANLDRIALSAFLAPVPLGLYAARTRLQLLAGILNQAATRFYYPLWPFGRRRADAGPLMALYPEVRRQGWRSWALASLALIAAAGPLLPFVLGPAYPDLRRASPLALPLAAPFIGAAISPGRRPDRERPAGAQNRHLDLVVGGRLGRTSRAGAGLAGVSRARSSAFRSRSSGARRRPLARLGTPPRSAGR